MCYVRYVCQLVFNKQSHEYHSKVQKNMNYLCSKIMTLVTS